MGRAQIVSRLQSGDNLATLVLDPYDPCDPLDWTKDGTIVVVGLPSLLSSAVFPVSFGAIYVCVLKESVP